MMPMQSPIGEPYSDLAVGLVTMRSPMLGDLWGGMLVDSGRSVG